MVFTTKRQLASLATLAANIAVTSARDVNCACGYRDPVTNDLWTDTAILYFNETTAESLAKNPDFIDLNFANVYESGYDTTYRQGSSNTNIALEENLAALQLTVNPSTKDHLVVGGAIRTARQDIQYGSFRAGLQPAQPISQGGTAMSMYYHFNESQKVEIDLNNGDTQDASSVYFQTALPGAYLKPTNYSFANVNQDHQAWQMNEWRFDWTPKLIEYSTSINSSVKHSISSEQHHLPSIPGAVYFKHWSTGSPDVTQGPPTRNSEAYIGYIRMFFNSTITSKASDFAAQCSILQESVCSTDDNTLRVSSTFSDDSTTKWKQVVEVYHVPKWAFYGAIITATIFLSLIVHAVVRRILRFLAVPKAERPVYPAAYTYKLDRFALHGELTRSMIKEKKRSEKAQLKAGKRGGGGGGGDSPIIKTREIDPDAMSLSSVATTVEPDGNSVRGFRALAGNRNSKVIAAALPTMYYARPGASPGPSALGRPGLQRTRSRLHQTTNLADEDEDEDDESMMDPDPDTPRMRSRSASDASDEDDEDVNEAYAHLNARPSDERVRDDSESVVAFRSAVNELPQERRKSIFQSFDVRGSGQKFWRRFFSGSPSKEFEQKQVVLKAATRIDYLDGIRGFACLLVSLIHFSLTFYSAFISPTDNSDAHYSWAKYIRYTIAPVFFNANFIIGVFFILSSRLIGAKYLKTGMFQDLAGSTFRRIPRLAFPALCAVVLEYFLIGVGATQWLQYLASVTWSTWPYEIEFKNPGWFINEFLALLFVQPPQLPGIIYNYCTGVLWTIPVSIEGSWLIFLGVIVIREIKTPWKRFGYYAFCMANGWYAQNWSSYFWMGLAICDLDVTYKYRHWAVNRWRSWVIVLSLWAVVWVALCTQWLQQFPKLGFSLATLENGIHPDLATGLPIYKASGRFYPEFQLPEIQSFIAATAVILLCDFSSSLQAIFNLRFLRLLGYYSYSIYLLHGVVFWSWGSWLTIAMATKGVPYWANMIVVFTSCYLLLALAIYVWTPFADVFSGYAGNALWRRAQGRSFFATIG